jgi:micrococcal nuclease
MADNPDDAYVRRATLRRIIDGDTFVLDVSLGYRIYAAITIRVHDYDAPEMVGVDKARGYLARDFAKALLSTATLVVIKSYKDEQSFARWIADVWCDDKSFKDLMIAAGHQK